mmetsp:Transcript_32366/g.64139  ORF Transcript_32366/g.64139 Transcript_32366/m.64139 type:complete len:171 (+) Transcript_32366:167-679(+)
MSPRRSNQVFMSNLPMNNGPVDTTGKCTNSHTNLEISLRDKNVPQHYRATAIEFPLSLSNNSRYNKSPSRSYNITLCRKEQISKDEILSLKRCEASECLISLSSEQTMFSNYSTSPASHRRRSLVDCSSDVFDHSDWGFFTDAANEANIIKFNSNYAKSRYRKMQFQQKC